MTLFSPDGKPIADDQDQWMAAALFSWLSDERVRTMLVNRGRATPKGIQALGGILDLSLREQKPIEPKILRKEMLSTLQDRIVRKTVARVVIENERTDYQAYRDDLARGMPMLPYDRRPLPPRNAKAVFKELQQIREELEARDVPDGLIVTP